MERTSDPARLRLRANAALNAATSLSAKPSIPYRGGRWFRTRQTAFRDDVMVAALAVAEGKTAEEVDDFFRLAAGL